MSKVFDLIKNVKTHWSVPYKGRTVPIKEIAAYGIGGMGAHWVTTLAAAIVLSANNLLVGAAIGIRPTDLQTMYIVSTILGFVFTFLRSYLFDNTKSKEGKFRPWIKWTGLPTVLASTLFVWMPYEKMQYNGKVVTVMICYILLNIFSPFFTDAFALLIQVMSADSDERTDIMSVTQILFSFAPSVANLVIPFLAQLTGGLDKIETYRYVYPPFTVVGLVFTWFLYKGTRERIVYSKGYENSVRFMDALRDISKNKYFWITNMATWLGFAETAYMVILGWTFVYAMPDKQQYLGLANSLIGNGALWAMMLAPFLIRRFGKRNLLIWCNIANVVLLMFMFPLFENLWAVIIVCYLNNFIGVFGNIYNPGIQADMKDYQQYKTGVRVDGGFLTMGIIGTVIGFGTGYFIPMIYEKMGLRDDYNVLYNPEIRSNIFNAVIIASIIGAVINVIPYFFYDLTEDKQRGMIRVLKIRAMFEDYGNEKVTDEALLEAMAYIETAEKINGKQPEKISKEKLCLAKKMPNATAEDKEIRKRAILDAKKEISAIREFNTDVAASPIIIEELRKFETLRYQKQLERAVRQKSKGVNGLIDLDESMIKDAKRMPNKTKEERLIKADAKEFARDCRIAKKLILTHYPNGINVFDPSRLKELEERAVQQTSIAQKIKEKIEISREIKKYSIYRRCMKPYANSVKLLQQAENYSHMNALRERYCALLESAQPETGKIAIKVTE